MMIRGQISETEQGDRGKIGFRVKRGKKSIQDIIRKLKRKGLDKEGVWSRRRRKKEERRGG